MVEAKKDGRLSEVGLTRESEAQPERLETRAAGRRLARRRVGNGTWRRGGQLGSLFGAGEKA